MIDPSKPCEICGHVDKDDLHWIQNDLSFPFPVSGPRILIGFWSSDLETVEENGPDFDVPPLFTITYPVGVEAPNCYGWSHRTGHTCDPDHPNSAHTTKSTLR